MDDSEDRDVCEKDDLLRRGVHVALALYLLPVVLIVLALGALFVAVGAVARFACAVARWLSGTKGGAGGALLAGVSREWTTSLPERSRVRTRASAGYPGADRLR